MSLVPEAPVALVVDDDPALRELLVEILAGLGIRALPVLDPETVVEVAAAHGPALIILDVMMPIMDGYTIATRLRGDPRTAGIPIVFVTGQEAPIYQTVSFGVGAVAFLPKPFSLNMLRAAVAQVLGR